MRLKRCRWQKCRPLCNYPRPRWKSGFHWSWYWFEVIQNVGRNVSIIRMVSACRKRLMQVSRTAEVSIPLKNGGHEPHKSHTYGDSVTITRRFQENGGSYKIKNADRKVVSAEKGELDAITDHFGIDVDNPMNILTQGKAPRTPFGIGLHSPDAARQFLSAANSTEKYRVSPSFSSPISFIDLQSSSS